MPIYQILQIPKCETFDQQDFLYSDAPWAILGLLCLCCLISFGTSARFSASGLSFSTTDNEQYELIRNLRQVDGLVLCESGNLLKLALLPEKKLGQNMV